MFTVARKRAMPWLNCKHCEAMMRRPSCLNKVRFGAGSGRAALRSEPMKADNAIAQYFAGLCVASLPLIPATTMSCLER